jgi:polysaccharide chain length determinant protein (PEP-CTERM system associated)
MLTPEVYSTIQRRPMDLSDYIDVARRHRGWIFGPLFAGVVIASVVAFMLPNTYVSSAELRITPAQISENILPSVLNQQMSERISEMQQDILSRTSLAEIIQRPALDLYKRERDREPLDDIIEKMRNKDVQIHMVAVPNSQGRTGGSAFTVSFAYPDRYKAKAVVDALLNRFMDSNDSQQKVAGSITTEFLSDEVQRAKADVDRLNAQLTQFRTKNVGRLPEELQVNAQALTSLQQQRTSMDEALNRDAQEKMVLEGRLDTLHSQRETLTTLAQQGADDPATTEQSDRLRDLNTTIAHAETQLAELREKYTDSHPDVVSAQAMLASLKKQRDQMERDDAKQASAPAKGKAGGHQSAATVAAVSNLQAQEDQVKSQLKALDLDRQNRAKEMASLDGEIAQFRGRLESGPANEQQYAQLVSDQVQVNQHYQDLLKKQGLAEENQQAQSRKAGENLEVLDPASLPVAPTAPNRWLIVGIGFALGGVIGLGLAALREIKDTSLKNLKDVRAYTQLPILGSIPLLENDLLVQRRRRISFLSWTAAVLLGVVAIGASMFYHFYVTKS